MRDDKTCIDMPFHPHVIEVRDVLVVNAYLPRRRCAHSEQEHGDCILSRYLADEEIEISPSHLTGRILLVEVSWWKRLLRRDCLGREPMANLPWRVAIIISADATRQSQDSYEA